MFHRSQILMHALRRSQAGPQEVNHLHWRRRKGMPVFGGFLLGLGAGYFMWGSERKRTFCAERARQHYWHHHGHDHVCPTCFYEKHGHYPPALNNGSQPGGVATSSTQDSVTFPGPEPSGEKTL
ncbi:hypothetical protein BX666DRAFT_1941233 [Dichotomocladium elegans]|nr:hypothetical protein BX666DRAFT_1941233 [Dichotomocladium elegans]